MSSEQLHTHHLMGLEKCSNEFECLTKLDIDLNNEYDSLLCDVRGLYSNYIILNQTKEKSQPKLKRSISSFLSDLYSSSSRGNKDLNKLLELKDSLTNPIDLVQSTSFVASLVFFLFSSYIMFFHDFISNLNINYSNFIGYVFVCIRFVAYHSFEFFKDFLHLCYLRLRESVKSVKNNANIFEVEWFDLPYSCKF